MALLSNVSVVDTVVGNEMCPLYFHLNGGMCIRDTYLAHIHREFGALQYEPMVLIANQQML